MPETIKNLAQAALPATTLTDLYTPQNPAVISTIAICNRSATATTYRLSHAVAGAPDTAAQYFVYDQALAGNTSQLLTMGVTMAAADKLRAYAGAATVSIVVWGVEKSA